MMKNQPKEITPALLDVVVMPNGEIICDGQTVGWVKTHGKYLTVNSDMGRALLWRGLKEKATT